MSDTTEAVKDGQRKLADICFEHDLRIDELIHIPTMCMAEVLDSDLISLFEDDWNDEIFALLGLEPLPGEAYEDRDRIGENLTWALRDQVGFAARVSTPVVSTVSLDDEGEIKSYSSNWGHTTMKWFYHLDCMAEIIQQAVAWKEELLQIEVEKEKVLNQPPSSGPRGHKIGEHKLGL